MRQYFHIRERGYVWHGGLSWGSPALHQGPSSRRSVLRLRLLCPARGTHQGTRSQPSVCPHTGQVSVGKKGKCFIIPIRILYFKCNFLGQNVLGMVSSLLSQVFHELNATSLILVNNSGGSKPLYA